MTDAEFDELEEIMSEAPGGENHGRRRAGGEWLRLDYAAAAFAELNYEYFVDIETHGTRSTYVDGCRCEPCRRANRDYQRQRRKGTS